MSEEPSDPLEAVDPDSVSGDDAAEIRDALSADVALVRQRGARACSALAARDAAAARPFVDDLLDRLDDESLAVARHAGTALVTLSDAYPGDVTDLEPAVTLAENELGGIRMLGARILGNVVIDHPECARPHVDRLLDAVLSTEGTYSQSDLAELADEAAGTDAAQTVQRQNMEEAKQRVLARTAIANVVVAVAEDDPAAVVDLVDDATPLLDDPDPNVVGAVLDVYRAVAEHDPAAVEGVVDSIADCLDRDDEMIRARAIRTLGFAGDDSVRPRLRELADEDDDGDVRALAAETADFLADG